jgi:hypothetical protein
MAESLAPLLVAPWLTAGVAVPLIAALLTRLSAVQRRMRAIAIAACALPLLFSLETARQGGTWLSR